MLCAERIAIRYFSGASTDGKKPFKHYLVFVLKQSQLGTADTSSWHLHRWYDSHERC
jgi:hypothetical protein